MDERGAGNAGEPVAPGASSRPAEDGPSPDGRIDDASPRSSGPPLAAALVGAVAAAMDSNATDSLELDVVALLGAIGRTLGASRITLRLHDENRSDLPDAEWRATDHAAGLHAAGLHAAGSSAAGPTEPLVVALHSGARTIGVLGIEHHDGDARERTAAAVDAVAAVGSLVLQIVLRLDVVAWLRSAYRMSPIGLAVCDTDDRIRYANEALAEFLGTTIEALAGTTVGSHLDGVETEDRRTPLRSSDRRFRRADGSEAWGRMTRTSVRANLDRAYTFVQVEDVTEQRLARERLLHDATHDHLTGLVNRRTLLAQVERELGSGHGACGLLLVDVDRFKAINDSLGHPEGDRLLETVAERLRDSVRSEDVVCRLGGDEFAVLLRAPVTVEQCLATANRLLDLMGEPVHLQASPVWSSVSIGVGLAHAGSTRDTMLREADAALYRAKAQGRNRAVLFDDEMRRATEERLRLEGQLRMAVSGGGLALHYQPEIELGSGRVTGVEALVRWPHHEHGVLGADEFVELAEEVGIIEDLGRWVLREACVALARWDDLDDLTMAINVSALQLARPGLVDDLRAALDETGVDASRLVLEITETAVMRDLDRTLAVLREMAAIGVELAIDDFGTGFSSLAHLKRLPVQSLKIDRSFVDDVGDPDGRIIVASVIGLGRSLGLRVVAEGITTDAQHDLLLAMGCDRAQGHRYAPALPEPDLRAWVAARRATPPTD